MPLSRIYGDIGGASQRATGPHLDEIPLSNGVALADIDRQRRPVLLLVGWVPSRRIGEINPLTERLPVVAFEKRMDADGSPSRQRGPGGPGLLWS